MSKEKQFGTTPLHKNKVKLMSTGSHKHHQVSRYIYRDKQANVQKIKSTNSSYYKKHCPNNYNPSKDTAKSSRRSYLYPSKLSKNLGEQQSIRRFISPTYAHKQKQMKSLRTFSPSMQLISSQLSFKKQQKLLAKKEADLIQRTQDILEKYRKSLNKERKQKQQLLKENKKLKQKLLQTSSEKRYHPINQYNF